MKRLAHALLGLGMILLLASFLPAFAAPAAPATPKAASGASRGAVLFVAKGCATCHRHDSLDGPTGMVPVGPDLSRYVPDPDFVRAWLSAPAALRPGTLMPDLDLRAAEIEELLAFLAQESPGGDG